MDVLKDAPLPKPSIGKLRVAVALVAVAIFTACGGGGPETEGERSAEPGATSECGPAEPALATRPKLPEGFPSPAGVTYTKAEKAGPSDLIEGYFNGDLSTAFTEYRTAFEGSGYDITKDEQEERDAEVFFAGKGTSGQVRLEGECEGRVDVRITIRPS